jgi:DNA-binding PucR family transcriptional regulator
MASTSHRPALRIAEAPPAGRALSRVGPEATAEGVKVVLLVAATAQSLLDNVDRVATGFTADMVGIIPALNTDADLMRENQLSICGNLSAIFTTWANKQPLSGLTIAAENLVLAHSLLHRGTPLEALFRPYRVGLPLFWRIWTEAIARFVDDQQVLVQALVATHAEMSDYFDRTMHALMVEYEAEHQRWISHDLARRNETIRALLSEESSPAPDRDALNHNFDAYQTALVVWTDSLANTDALETLGNDIADQLKPLTHVCLTASTTTMWVWLATDRPIGASDIESIGRDTELRIAVGRSMQGLCGFRSSHSQALRTQQVAICRGRRDPGHLTTYDDVEIAALMISGERATASDFVHHELGALAADTQAMRRLRDTLAIYLAEGHNARRAAERLFLHKNTILYRVDRAQSLLPNPIQLRQLEIQLALRLVDFID